MPSATWSGVVSYATPCFSLPSGSVIVIGVCGIAAKHNNAWESRQQNWEYRRDGVQNRTSKPCCLDSNHAVVHCSSLTEKAWILGFCERTSNFNSITRSSVTGTASLCQTLLSTTFATIGGRRSSWRRCRHLWGRPHLLVQTQHVTAALRGTEFETAVQGARRRRKHSAGGEKSCRSVGMSGFIPLVLAIHLMNGGNTPGSSAKDWC